MLMDPDFLEHLERIDSIGQALARLAWIGSEELEAVGKVLLDFDSEYWTFTKYLSLPLYQELEALLCQAGGDRCFSQRPRLAVVVPVHKASDRLLRSALRSLKHQVGVTIECLISVDGDKADLELVRIILADLGANDDHWKASVVFSEVNRGVGMCRNMALKELTSPWFTFLDDDDLFHPLRCLHGLLLMTLEDVPLIKTSSSRVSMTQKKIVLINNSLLSCGLNSFMASAHLLKSYGYLADLRYYEDTEYMQRLQFFQVPHISSGAVGHYLHTEPHADYVSLASPWRLEVHAIEGHPYLCGSVIAAATEECIRYDTDFRQQYKEALSCGLLRCFPSSSI